MDQWSKDAVARLALEALQRERAALKQALRENWRAQRNLQQLTKDMSTVPT